MLSAEICAGRSKARIPWSKIQEAQDDFIDPEHLPEGIRITQFHHLRQEEAESILNHWVARQAAGATIFQFKKTERVTRRGKQASASPDEEQASASANEEQAPASADEEQAKGNADEGLSAQVRGDVAEDPHGVSCFPSMVTVNTDFLIHLNLCSPSLSVNPATRITLKLPENE